MKKSWGWVAAVLFLLGILAVFSSSSPDAVQRALHVEGGSVTLGKALVGMVVVMLTVLAFLHLLRRLRNDKR